MPLVKLIDVRAGQCRYIAGEPTADALCWCAAHEQVVYDRPRTSRSNREAARAARRALERAFGGA
jgi:hypothetical protein